MRYFLLVFFSISGFANNLIDAQSLDSLWFYPEYSAAATIESIENTTLSAQINGIITQINVDIGESITQGMVLAKIDCQDYQHQLSKEQAQLQALAAQKKLASLDLTRIEKLLTRKVTSQDEFDIQQAQYDNLEAQYTLQEYNIEIAKLNIKRCNIISPFQGIVHHRMIDKGMYVSIADPLFSIQNPDNIEARAKVPYFLIPLLKKSNTIHFYFHQQNYPVTIININPIINTSDQNQVVRLNFIDDKAAIGSQGRIIWQSKQPHLPADFLQKRGNTIGFFILKNQKAQFVPLDNAKLGQPIAINLPKETLVITRGRYGLQDGDTINKTVTP